MWTEDNNKLSASLSFSDFRSAIAFMVESSFYIEDMNHHPEWRNVYNKVEIELTTHDAGNIVTDKDRKLSEILDRLYKKYVT